MAWHLHLQFIHPQLQLHVRFHVYVYIYIYHSHFARHFFKV